VKRETRAWNPDMGSTQPLRGKEEEEEYGYIFEPDLTRMEIPKALIEKTKRSLPELPDEKMARYVSKLKIPPKLAESIVSDPEIAGFFEEVSKKVSPKVAATWVAGPVKKTLNYYTVRLSQTALKPEWLAELLKMFGKGMITDRNAELVIRKMVEEKKEPLPLIVKYGLGTVDDRCGTEKIISDVITKNPKAAGDYKAGEEKALHFLVGQVMKETRGRIDANSIRKEIMKLLK